ncbi:MAG: ATP-binding cassette domain-containing protein [Nevskia sp.]|nr:ATP-binding cassette domain-containing protein [Nevskia sp.]
MNAAAGARTAADDAVLCRVEGLTMAFGARLIQEQVDFAVRRGEIFVILGGSGCGKSTLLKHLIGLIEPVRGRIRYDGVDYWDSPPETRDGIRRRFGIMFQSGALFTAMTLAENVALPLQLYTRLRPAEIAGLVRYKLGLVGLRGSEEYYPAELSGGMRKRAALARALALDPDLLFLDEPSAGLDPISSRRLDDLVLELRDGTGASFVIVTHELPSLMRLGDNGIFLDAESKVPIAYGAPRTMLERCPHPTVQAFLKRESQIDEPGT